MRARPAFPVVFLEHFRRGCLGLCCGFCFECFGIYLSSRCLCFALFIEVAFRNLGVTGTRLSFGSSILGNALQTIMNGSAGRCLLWESSSRKHPGMFVQMCQKLRVWGLGLFCFVFCTEPFTITRDVFPRGYLFSNKSSSSMFFQNRLVKGV